MAGREYLSDQPTVARPWPRFWARFLDVQLYILPVALVFGALFPGLFDKEVFQGRQGDLLAGILCLPFALALDAIILSKTGSSIGKAVAGIFLATTDGTRLPLGQSFIRSAHLYAKGAVLGIPILTLIGYAAAFNDLRDNDSTSWDRETESRVYTTSGDPSRTWAVAVLAVVVYVIGTGLSQMSESGGL